MTRKAKVLPLAALILLFVAGCRHTRDTPRGLVKIEMIAIEGGSFDMGDVFTYEDIDATPVHPVTVAGFLLANTETTFEQYDAFALKAGLDLPDSGTFARGSNAVINVNWDEATAFCASYRYRLPTEQEWEYAARERGKAILYSGVNDEKLASEFVNHQPIKPGQRNIRVAQLKPNALGLYDMSGNVYEWLSTYYEFYPNPEDEPVYQDAAASGMRAVRGGSVETPLVSTRTYRRAATLRTTRAASIGFRCAQNAH